MKLEDVEELHYISPIANVPSILKHGILSHHLADKMDHRSIAMPEIQDRRRTKQVPGGRRLHDYVNLYFEARNPMLSKVRARNSAICILAVGPDVLKKPGVVITDQNAASDYVRFYNTLDGLATINKETLRARSWIHTDQIEKWKHASAKCAEVLVPDKVESPCVREAYVANETALEAFRKLEVSLKVRILADFFF
ncbi:MAG TPA: DUF4433 domain-containing protein [Opitutaceae bacterium]|nr:DUF4433 domain-containing protein [Opitutaceae bacterium]